LLVGPSNKFATIAADGSIEIIGDQFGVWRDGIWLSNTVHESPIDWGLVRKWPTDRASAESPARIGEPICGRIPGYWDDLKEDMVWILHNYDAPDVYLALADLVNSDDCPMADSGDWSFDYLERF
jgi:hypothetical protein